MRIGGQRVTPTTTVSGPTVGYGKWNGGGVDLYDKDGNKIASNVSNNSGKDFSGEGGYFYVIIEDGVIVDVPTKYEPCELTDGVVTCWYSQLSQCNVVASWFDINGTFFELSAQKLPYFTCPTWNGNYVSLAIDGVLQAPTNVIVGCSRMNAIGNGISWGLEFGNPINAVCPNPPNFIQGRCQECDVQGGGDVNGNTQIKLQIEILENQPFDLADIEGP